MPRERRKYSQTQIYHIMVRGNSGRDIFLDDGDRKKFLKTLSLKKMQSEFKLYAFCLMKNHFHLCLKEGQENVSNIMKRVNTTYAQYFNKKYQVTGHLFQNRFKSEAVENDAYLISLVRYIHQNPIKAGITNSPEEYPWSSCATYFQSDKSSFIFTYVDYEEVLKIFSTDLEQAIEEFKRFSSKNETEYKFLEDKKIAQQIKKVNTEFKLIEYVNKFLEKNKITLNELSERKNKSIRDQLILQLKEESIYSIREIAGILGISRGLIQNVNRKGLKK
jgi:putative transposase